MLTRDEEAALIDAYLDHGNIKARNDLITAYRPLVVSAARAFEARGTSEFNDLVQEGMLGLAESIDNFKRNKKARVSTLAKYYIKARMYDYAMNKNTSFRVGTNLPDKRVYMNLRRMVSEIQAVNGGVPITDADRQEIADKLGVKMHVVQRMEPRIFANDVAVSHTDYIAEDQNGAPSSANGIIPVDGEQGGVDVHTDQKKMMERIRAIIESNYSDRDLHIISERINGEMTQEKYKTLVGRYGITVERIRQIQRGALDTIRENLISDGICSIDDIAV